MVLKQLNIDNALTTSTAFDTVGPLQDTEENDINIRSFHKTLWQNQSTRLQQINYSTKWTKSVYAEVRNALLANLK